MGQESGSTFLGAWSQDHPPGCDQGVRGAAVTSGLDGERMPFQAHPVASGSLESLLAVDWGHQFFVTEPFHGATCNMASPRAGGERASKQKPQSFCNRVEVPFHLLCPVLVIEASHEAQPLSSGGGGIGGESHKEVGVTGDQLRRLPQCPCLFSVWPMNQ